ncbi:MAG TPA: adenosylcobinamide-GDP ribazoletransferase [Methyloceanibacter sp.]|nr:adenosylcobinamide-GDP ribazoletransferase [Methyloceanibacter sp.]
MTNGTSLSGLSTELRTGLAFLTRLPLVHPVSATGADVAQASWSFPVAGAVVGGIGALVYWLADGLNLDPILSAILAVAATLVVTGALHEDGLADTADGFGASASRERKLDIMRDSEIGTYGASALILSFMLRVGAVVSLADPGLAAAALIAAHAGARATLPVFMRIVPNARQDGLSAIAGEPPQRSALMALLLGLLALLLCLGLGATFIAALLLACAIGLMAWLCVTQIGGQTGDVLGTLEQVSEMLILLVAAAWL